MNETNKTYAKTVIINRAVPGSGKTTISRCIAEALFRQGIKIGNHSTDEFFMQGNRYCFDISKLHEYHLQNQRDFELDLQRTTDVVICDNTNLQPWEAAPYTRMAREYGYRVLFLNFLPRELWKHVQSQIVTPEKPDAHQVPEARLAEFIQDFQDYNDLLDKNNSADPLKQKDFRWDNAQFCPVETGKPASNFDSDEVFTIRPDEYQTVKKSIGKKVLNFIHI